MSDFLNLQGAKDLNTDAIHIKAVANSIDPVTGAPILTHVNRVGGTDYTLQGFWNALGPVVMPWTSVTGGTLTQPNQAFLHPANGNYYSWTDAYPAGGYVVAPGTDPTAVAGYVPRSDVVLRAELLAASNGASLIGGVSQVFATVADMKSFSVVAGRVYKTNGYYSSCDGGGAVYYAESTGSVPDGYGDHTASNGVFLRLHGTPTDLNNGVIVNSTYDVNTAWHNRNAIQTMLRNTKCSYFEFTANGTYYILGSINVGRDDLYINHKKGCKIIGRYSDPSVPNSITSQAGGLFCFTRYVDPDNGVFLPVTEFTYRNVYQLDGDIETEYNAIHQNRYNNNCIGFCKIVDSSVVGSGGISGSDHRGINFDGDAINCHIDIAYCDNVVDNGLMIQASNTIGNHCTIKVGRIGKMLSGGYGTPIAVRTLGGFSYDIEIGSFNGDNVIKPQLVGCYNSQLVKAKVGYVNGASCLLRQYETLNAEIEVGLVYNTPTGIIRAGTTANKMRSARLHGIKLTDANFLAAYSDQVTSNRDAFARLEIDNNNFSNAPSSFVFYNSRATAGLPVRLDIHDNLTPVSFTPVEFNMHTMGITYDGLITVGATSAEINYKSPDWNYGKMTIIASDGGGVRYEVMMDIRSRTITGYNVNYDIGTSGGFIATTVSGSSITLTCTSCALQVVTMHN